MKTHSIAGVVMMEVERGIGVWLAEVRTADLKKGKLWV